MAATPPAFVIPPLPPGALSRPRLLEALQQASCPFVVLRAGAGWGKTVLAAQWAASQPQASWRDLARVENPAAALRSFKDAHTALIVDHYLPGDAALDGVIESLIETRPAGAKLVLLSRAEPSLDLAKRRVAGQVTELLEDELAFTRDEVAALWQVGPAQPGIAQDEALLDVMMARSEGWPLAVHVAARMWAAGNTLDTLSGTGPPLEDYLAKEIWAALEPDHRNFLLVTSVLHELRPDWCDALTEREGSLRTLRTLRALGAPVAAPRSVGAGYRYRPLFREFLLGKLEEEPSYRRELEQRAARALAGANRPLEATAHALAAQEWELALACLYQSADRLFRQRGAGDVRDHLGRFPESYRERPELLRVEGYLAWAAGDHALALTRAEQVTTSANATLRADALLLRAAIHGTQGDHGAEIAALSEAVACQPDDRQVRAKLHYALGSAYQKSGDLAEAEASLRRAEADTHEGEPVHAAVLGLVPLIKLAQGKPRAAVRGLERALGASRALGNRRGEAYALYHLALALNQSGQHPRALEVLDGARRLADELHLSYLGALVMREMADALRDLSAPAALPSYREAISALDALGAAAGLLHAHHGLAVYHRRHGDLAAARREAERALTHASAGDAAFVSLVRCHLALLQEDASAAAHLGDVLNEPQRYYQAQALLYAAAATRTAAFTREALTIIQDEGFEHLLQDERTLIAPLVERLDTGLPLGPEESPRCAFQLRLCGDLEVTDVQQRSLRLRPQALHLLAYLALRRGATVDPWQIIDTLWPTRGKEMKGTLQTLVWLLRRSLFERVVVTHRAGYAFDPDRLVWVDTEAFGKHLRQGHFEEGIALYRGELLPGAAWADLERRHLETQYLSALESLAGRYLEAGRLEEGTLLLEKVVALDPLAEEALEKLIACHRTAGRADTARRLRQTFHRNLEGQLGAS